MKPVLRILGISLILWSSCCPRKACDLQYYSTTFIGFPLQEVDSIRIISRDTVNGGADTIFTEAIPFAGNADTLSITAIVPFNKNCSYDYYLPETGAAFHIGGYELSQESCSTCFAWAASDDNYDVLEGYRVNGARQVGRSFIIRK